MRLNHLPGDVHLTYCTNIHAGESWDEVRDSLEAHLPPIKAQVSPDAPLGLGLRLSAIAAHALSAPAALSIARPPSRHVFSSSHQRLSYGPFPDRVMRMSISRLAEHERPHRRGAEILARCSPTA